MTNPKDYTPIPPVAPPSMEDCCSNLPNMPAVQKELMSHRAIAPAAYHDDDDMEQQQQQGLEDDTHRKLCRICLDTDHPDTMIAPCLCKGGSQWVHRDCLDEWRVHEEDRAFSQCTECNFHYHFVDTRHERRQLKARFWLFVSRDVCLVTVAVQVVILCLSWMVRALDVWQLQLTLLHFLCLDCENDAAISQHTITNSTTATTSMGALRREEFAIYYAYGFISLLVLLGMTGSIVLCQNRCQIPDYLKTETARHTTCNEETRGITTANEQQPHHPQQHQLQPSTTTTTTTTTGREQFYQSRRHQRNLSREGTDLRRGSCCECCCAPTTSSRYYSGYPYYYGPNYVYYGPYYTGNADSSCCCCCCDGSNTTNTNSDCDCCCPFHVGVGGGSGSGHSGGGNGGGDAMHILLVIVLIVVIVMAVIGFIVGVFLSIFIAQRIIQRHILLLEKRRLVDDFPVKDLSGSDVTTMMMTPPVEINHPEGTELGSMTCATPTPIPPPRTCLRPEDSSHLKKLGLLKD